MPEESNLSEKLQEKQSEVKFTEEELKQVKDIQISYADTTNKFGQLKLGQIRLDSEEVILEEALKNIQQKEQKFLDGITEKYGQGSLNPETGVFTPNKSE